MESNDLGDVEGTEDVLVLGVNDGSLYGDLDGRDVLILVEDTQDRLVLNADEGVKDGPLDESVWITVEV